MNLIKSLIKNTINSLSYWVKKLSVNRSWKRRFKRTCQFQSPLSKIEKKIYLNKWSILTKSKINLSTVEQVKGLTGTFNIDIVPEEVFALNIEPKLNYEAEIPFFENKSTCAKWFGENIFPKTYIHNIDGVFYSDNYNEIKDPINYLRNIICFPFIAKPNKDSYGGVGVVKIKNFEELKSYINSYGENFIFQELIQACSFLNELTGNRPVSLRVCTYRSVNDNQIHILNTTLRLGWNESLDNETAGGIYLNIDTKGGFSEYALNSSYMKYYEHPNTGIRFNGKSLPFYSQLLVDTKKLAAQIPFARTLSFDMILDKNDEWRVFEVNILGQTIRFAQNYAIPFFSEFTDEIINYTTKNKFR